MNGNNFSHFTSFFGFVTGVLVWALTLTGKVSG
jgi:hypothetical protein